MEDIGAALSTERCLQELGDNVRDNDTLRVKKRFIVRVCISIYVYMCIYKQYGKDRYTDT